MKKNKNKGFSLIELLAAIVIIAILATVSIATVTRYIDRTRKQKVVQNKKNVAMAAELYLQANRDLMPKMIGEITYIPIKDLRNTNYIKEDVTNERGEDCMNESFVRVFKLAEGDYNYTTYLYCGDEKAPDQVEPPKPYLVDYNDNDRMVKVLFSKSDDVKKANFSFKLRGSQNDENIGIYSYSYTILARTNENNNYTEVYNSGTIEVNKSPVVEFKSRAISSYVDLPGVTSIQVKISALNEQGGYLSYETDYMAAGGATQYEDTLPPVCPDLDDESGRQGEPKDMSSWINKNSIDTAGFPRVITLKCDDGAGSGCKRDTFTESWPNPNKEPLGRMFGDITIEDNSVVDSQGRIKEPNKSDCPVLVLVDLQSPSVDLTIINPKPVEGASTNASKDILYHNHTYQNETIPIRDKSEPVKGNIEDTTLTINSINYDRAYSEFDSTQGWLNSTYYPEGVEYQLDLADNIYLYKVTWETNKPYLNADSPEYMDISVDNPEGMLWERIHDEELALDEEALVAARQEIPPEQNRKTLKIHFKEEGARYGVLTVFDRSGNETKITIFANVDRTFPKIDEGNYPIVPYTMDNPGEPNEQEDPNTVIETPQPSNNGNEEEIVDYSNWEGNNYMRGFNICMNPQFYGNLLTEEEKEDVTGIKCDSTVDYGLPPQTCESHRTGYGSVYGSDTGKVERPSTGCYKIGTTEGDNGIAPKDFLNDNVFFNLEEYKSGTWSNEELICGPKYDMILDNRYTAYNNEGQKQYVDIENELSGWVAVEIYLYKQIGVDITYDYWQQKYIATPKYGDDVDDPTQVEHYIVNSLDRTTWPIIDDQGTHRLKWKNCDKAGNCTDFQLTENIKIDTIKPKCQTSISYNEEPNSDGGTGPNHNGWLYDKQSATVSNSCADSSIKENDDYFKSIYSIRNSFKEYFGGDYFFSSEESTPYLEFGSGCLAAAPTTNTFTYDDDVFTCNAGADGVDKLGTVVDLAGNVTQCETGATVKKDTTPPSCGTSIYYKGENGEEDSFYKFNTPNREGWAIGGMEITAVKYCNDSANAKKSKYNDEFAFSSCLRTDDAENGVYVRVPESYQGTAPTVSYYGEGRTFYATNNHHFTIESDKDIYGYIGAEGFEYDYETQQYTMTPGYVVDAAGNISTEPCTKEIVAKDSVPPTCSQESVAENGEFKIGEYGNRWVGSNGFDGNEEYVKVFKVCNDHEVENYPGLEGTVKSDCKIDLNDDSYFWIYGNVEDPGTDRHTPGERKGGGATFEGPDKVVTGDLVKDRAGNKGVGVCDPIEVNIDYTPPSCEVVPSEEWTADLIEYNPEFQRWEAKSDHNTENSLRFYISTYYGTWTKYHVYVSAICSRDNDNGSGCDPLSGNTSDTIVKYVYNEETQKVDKEYLNQRKTYTYGGFEGTFNEELYSTDFAGNITSCERDITLKQDRVDPKVKCSYRGDYKVDDHPDSYIEVTIEGLEDPLGQPSNVATGINYKGQDYTDFINNNMNISNSYSPNMLYTTTSHYIIRPDGTSFYASDPYSGGNIASSEFISNNYISNIGLAPYDLSDKYKYYLFEVIYESKGIYYDYAKSHYNSETGQYESETHIPLEPGKTVYKIPLTCNNRFQADYRPYVTIHDLVGNSATYECEGEPIHVPGCCDKTIEESFDQCEGWKWSSCTRPCSEEYSYTSDKPTPLSNPELGTKMQYNLCVNKGYYNNGKTCTSEYTISEDTPCNRFDCCDSYHMEYSACNSVYSENPCSEGYRTERAISDYDYTVYCKPTMSYLCEVNPIQCDELNKDDEVVGGHILPGNLSCELYTYGYTQLNDVVEFRPTDPVNCKIRSAGSTTNCTTWIASDTSMRSNINRFVSNAYSGRYYENRGCILAVTWDSTKYNFDERPELRNRTYVVTKTKNEWKHRYEYCIFNSLPYDSEFARCVDGQVYK